jgi:hypothetical protein
MKKWNLFTCLIHTLTVGIFITTHCLGQTTSRLSTSFLTRGEQALLEVAVAGSQRVDLPEFSPVKDVMIQPLNRGPQTRYLPGRKLETVFEYIVSGYEIGSHVIPPIEVLVDGISTFTEPIDFVIFNPDNLQWSEVKTADKIIRYASAFRVISTNPFENETITTEIKIFVPEELVVEDWGIPDFERDGVAAWRFQPSPMRGRVNLLGSRHVAVAYPSTVTPTRKGKVGIGPAKIRLTTREVVMDPFPRQVNNEVYLQVPKLEIEAKPLPDGAPEGFENAVGSFKLAASTSETQVQEGDPISVDIIVTGTGNLDILKPPKLENAAGWKIYGTTTEQRGDERRQLSGNVVFHQSIRPLEMKSEIPSFRLVYFDPKDLAYKTLTTEPIALQMSPNTSPPVIPGNPVQTLSVPFERMTDILAVLRPAQLTLPAASALPSWFGHAIGGLIALGLITKAWWMRYAPRFRKNPELDLRSRQLRDIGKTPIADDEEFLKASGGFIERWLDGNHSPEIKAILAERDALCFRVDKRKSLLDPKRRDEILKLLRTATMAFMVIAFIGYGSQARAADVASQALEAYESAKYEDAVKLWLGAGNYDQLSADTLYNIGNACYRAGSPGQAALYYRRALVRDSGHQESRQNLRFIELKYGAISVQRPDYQYAIARFPLSAWQATFWTGLWLCGLALLVFPATRHGAGIRLVASGVLVVGPLLVASGLLGWRYYPNDATFSPLERQAVIIGEKIALHTDAARTAPEVIDAPPGSLCEIIRVSGRWAYVAFASKTRGWIPIESIEKVVPEKAPAPPNFRKPKSDGKSA